MLFHWTMAAGLIGCVIWDVILSGVEGKLINSTYKIYPGYSINTVLEITKARSVRECASLCSNLGNTNVPCRSVTFHNETGMCSLSNDSEEDLNDHSNPAYKTLALTMPDLSYIGTEFYTGYLNNIQMLTVLTQLYMTARVPTNVTIYIPCLSVNETFYLSDALIKTYSKALLPDSNGVSNKGIYVHSDKPISLFRANNAYGSTSMSAVLPKSSLGMNYIVQANPKTDTSFTVISTKDNTTLTITVGVSTSTYTLGRLDSVYTTSALGVSGSVVSADVEVVVVAGALCTQIPDGATACDNVSETLPAEESFGYRFVISQMYPRPGFTMGIVAKEQSTSVTITDQTGNVLETFIMNRADVVYRQYNVITTLIVSAASGIQVAQYGHGHSTQSSSISFGDPSMMVIPPIEKYGWKYDVLVPAEDMNVIEVIADDENLIRFNDVTLTFAHALSVHVPDYGTLKVGYVMVTNGRYQITHVTDAHFAVFLYGGHVYGEYAFSAGWMK